MWRPYEAPYLGAADASNYLGSSTRFAVRDGKITPISREEWRQLPAEEQLDAVLYLGTPSTITNALWSPSLCADAEYMKMRLHRMEVAGIPPIEREQLLKHCKSVAK